MIKPPRCAQQLSRLEYLRMRMMLSLNKAEYIEEEPADVTQGTFFYQLRVKEVVFFAFF